ncbi:homoserine O-acetyltransferase [Acidihalobacter yilgarnensis]|uniref:Serine O-succinyltransferase n=1 Tax=Acidihalobacter yilgarnensis TaxID=2819280 RepID=A0A1D8IQL5_9GAMM|nr:homoserine O-acetyltransferase [Acidihalobacter yilgarnensis]AOU98725.1 homoserine O-acetyltransferase [Acidihalobacter yilgarnensis]
MPSTVLANQPSADGPVPSRGTRSLSLEKPFSFYRGGVLPRLEISYESWGTLNAARDNAVLIFSGLSANAHVATSVCDPQPGWWEYMLGPGKPLDTNRHYVICVNSLGSCYGSTGPASIDPATGRPYGPDFPRLSVEDIAAAGRELLRALGLRRLSAMVGASLGGMSALAFALQTPEMLDRLVLISSAAHPSAHAIAMRSLQREIVRADPAWADGRYTAPGPVDGMRLARKLGISCYRSPEEWEQRFGHRRASAHSAADQFEVESYLAHNASKFALGFDANAYLALSRAMDDFDAADHGDGELDAALARLGGLEALVIGVRTDTLFPESQQRALADGLRRAGARVRYAGLDSPQGHDAFLIDEPRFAPVMRDFFAADAG